MTDIKEIWGHKLQLIMNSLIFNSIGISWEFTFVSRGKSIIPEHQDQQDQDQQDQDLSWSACVHVCVYIYVCVCVLCCDRIQLGMLYASREGRCKYGR